MIPKPGAGKPGNWFESVLRADGVKIMQPEFSIGLNRIQMQKTIDELAKPSPKLKTISKAVESSPKPRTKLEQNLISIDETMGQVRKNSANNQKDAGTQQYYRELIENPLQEIFDISTESRNAVTHNIDNKVFKVYRGRSSLIIQVNDQGHQYSVSYYPKRLIRQQVKFQLAK